MKHSLSFFFAPSLPALYDLFKEEQKLFLVDYANTIKY